MRILLSAYACEPNRGSEPGVGWSWATELAQLGHQVWALTRDENRASIERDAHADSPNLNFIYYDLPRWVQRMRKHPAGKLVYHMLWQWGAARQVRRHFPELPFDLVHHVTYVSARYPSFMGSLGLPFYFGPVAGGERVPYRLRSGFSLGQHCRELARDLSDALVRHSPMMRGVFRRASRIFISPDTLALIPRRFRQKCQIQMPVYLTAEYLHKAAAVAQRSGLNILYAGRLVDWKGLDIAIRAIHHLRQSHPEVHFTIVGEGPSKAKLKKLIKRLELSSVVECIGWVPQSILEEHYRCARLVLFPSLRDAGATAVVEALAHGLPVVCANLGGPRVIVNERCGRVVPLTGGREELAVGFADAVAEIVSTPRLWDSLSAGALERAREFNFSNLAQAIYPDSPFLATNLEHERSLQLNSLVPRDAAL